MEDGKSMGHILAELVEEDNLMVRLQFQQEEEPVFVKFKGKREYDNFLNTIMSESQGGSGKTD